MKRNGISAVGVLFVAIISVAIAIYLQITGTGGRQVPNSPIAILFIIALIAVCVILTVIVIKRRS